MAAAPSTAANTAAKSPGLRSRIVRNASTTNGKKLGHWDKALAAGQMPACGTVPPTKSASASARKWALTLSPSDRARPANRAAKSAGK
jgi:hypothetical protein